MKKIEPGEWQEERDPYGNVRRYRMLGPIKEYEPTIIVNGIEIPQRELEDFNRRSKERAAAQSAQIRRAAPAQKSYICPFTGGNHACRRDKCALYTGRGCTLAQIATTAARDTAGKSCPFSPYSCRNDCSLYKTGCVLTAIKERM